MTDHSGSQFDPLCILTQVVCQGFASRTVWRVSNEGVGFPSASLAEPHRSHLQKTFRTTGTYEEVRSWRSCLLSTTVGLPQLNGSPFKAAVHQILRPLSTGLCLGGKGTLLERGMEV